MVFFLGGGGGVTELILRISLERDGAKERWLLWRTRPAIDELTPAAPGRFQSKVVSMRAAWSAGLQPLGSKPARAVRDDNSRRVVGAVGRLNQEWMSPFPADA